MRSLAFYAAPAAVVAAVIAFGAPAMAQSNGPVLDAWCVTGVPIPCSGDGVANDGCTRGPAFRANTIIDLQSFTVQIDASRCDWDVGLSGQNIAPAERPVTIAEAGLGGVITFRVPQAIAKKHEIFAVQPMDGGEGGGAFCVQTIQR